MAKIDDPKFQAVLEAIVQAGDEGLTLDEITAKTGHEYRAVHNETWRLEGSPRDGGLAKPEERFIHRVNTDGKVRYQKVPAGTPRPVAFIKDKPDTGHTYATIGKKDEATA